MMTKHDEEIYQLKTQILKLNEQLSFLKVQNEGLMNVIAEKQKIIDSFYQTKNQVLICRSCGESVNVTEMICPFCGWNLTDNPIGGSSYDN